ncbi:MAG: hypothetical protein ACK4N5_11075 [Myxococcales bacterium]
MKTALLTLASLLVTLPALAADVELFGSGKPPTWSESKIDKRFAKTRIAQALENPPTDRACAKVVGTLLTAFAEGAPYFHKKDQTFYLDPTLVGWFQEQLTTDRFPALAYLQMMVRRAMIEGKAPEAWLKTAKTLKARSGAPIDLERLSYAADGVQLIDSFLFTLPMLQHRYQNEILLATSAGAATAQERFENQYLDRDVAWSGLLLADVVKVTPEKPKKGKKGKAEPPPEEPQETAYWATLLLPTQSPAMHPLFRAPPATPIVVRVKLQPEQYVDVKKAVKATRYMTVGRLWAIRPGDGEVSSPVIADLELRDGLLFRDRDWSSAAELASLATMEDVMGCPLAVNDLSETGLRDRQGLLSKDAFEK